MTTPPKIPEEYNQIQWTHDLFHCIAPQAARSTASVKNSIENYFYQNYPDDLFSCWKMMRLFAAYYWIVRHRHDVEREIPQLAVTGDNGFGVSKHLAVALFRIYAANGDNLVAKDFPLDMVLKMAREEIQMYEDRH